MIYKFSAKGHQNILANHKNTFEFTKDKMLSKEGDCIIGIKAGFKLNSIKKLLKYRTLQMSIYCSNYFDHVEFLSNKKFSSDKELVVRISDFLSERTLGIRATKSAKHLDRKLAKCMQDTNADINVIIRHKIKLIIFDFDDTLEDFKSAVDYAHKKIALHILKRYGVLEPTTLKILQEIDTQFSIKGKSSSPAEYDRKKWFLEFFKKIGVLPQKGEIEELTTFYWRYIIKSAKPLKGAKKVLNNLKKNYSLVIMSDSDGSKDIKIDRMKTTGIFGLIDYILLSDDTNINKPDKSFYDIIFKKFQVKPDECVMVGDKPQVDLKLAKKIGMSTVWMKHGNWAARESLNKFNYVDFEISDLKKLPEVIFSI